MSLPKNVWKLGETIPVHVECSVKGGSSDVDKVVIKSKISPYIFLYVNNNTMPIIDYMSLRL